MIGDWKNSGLCLEGNIYPVVDSFITFNNIYNYYIGGDNTIDETATFERYGYYSTDLKPKSHKPIIVKCEECGQKRTVLMKDSHGLCRNCSYKLTTKSSVWKASASEKRRGVSKSQSHKDAIGKANKGKRHSNESKRKMSIAKIGTKLSDETKLKISNTNKGVPKPPRSPEHYAAISAGNKGLHSGELNENYGKRFSDEHRHKLSAAKQGIPYDEWESYSTNSPYCPKFNESCKESNRDKYGRECFICGLPEAENITSTGQSKKLSVHHIDMNRDQGCNGNRWKLIPVCIHCHGTLHNETMESRITYILHGVNT